jgi:surfeit locus 1 family protein
MTLLAILVAAGLIALGRWQLSRAEQKRLLYQAFERGADSTVQLGPASAPLERYQHVALEGSYDPDHQVLIDNMTNERGQPGYFIITPFLLNGGTAILVNRGWVPLGPSRARLPAVSVPGTSRTIHGRADHLPAPGIELSGRAALAPPFPAVASFPHLTEFQALLPQYQFNRAAPMVLLDAGEADGYRRAWSPPGFPPIRHLGYALQWFALAAAVFVIFIVTNLKRRPPP